MYISARSNILEGEELRFKGTWMRISRRAVRDYNFRGTDLLETLLMWYNVRRGEKKYISPYKGRAHVIIDSSLRYEVPVFAHYADALRAAVEQVPPDNERWQEYHDLAREGNRQTVQPFAQRLKDGRQNDGNPGDRKMNADDSQREDAHLHHIIRGVKDSQQFFRYQLSDDQSYDHDTYRIDDTQLYGF